MALEEFEPSAGRLRARHRSLNRSDASAAAGGRHPATASDRLSASLNTGRDISGVARAPIVLLRAKPRHVAQDKFHHPAEACTSGTYPAASTFTVHAGVSTVTVVFSSTTFGCP